jgi:hypothetical protein
LVGATIGEQLSMWDHIGKVRYNFPTGIEKFKYEKNTLVKDPGNRICKRSKSYMQRYLGKLSYIHIWWGSVLLYTRFSNCILDYNYVWHIVK